jgi:hypothetical protein
MLAYINRLEAPSKSPMNQASRPIYKITGPIYTPSPHPEARFPETLLFLIKIAIKINRLFFF